MIRVLIADDHAVVRTGLKQILNEAPDIEVCDEAENGHQVMDKVRQQRVDVLLLDISMPGRGGLDVLRELKVEMPNLPILILTMHPAERYALRVIKDGAAGYLTKESAAEELVAAVRRVALGGKYIDMALAEYLASNLEKGDAPLHEALSDREYQVMLRLGSGRTVKEIAEELSLSIKTISTYRCRILEKTGLKNNAELVYYAVTNNLVDS